MTTTSTNRQSKAWHAAQRKGRRDAWVVLDRAKYVAKAREAMLKRTYGLTPLDFELMRTIQGNRCECCREVFTKTPQIDHNHATGAVRALLCNGCNAGLGMFKDSPVKLLQAVAYLATFNCVNSTPTA